jgi:predicted metal-dependent HD superfamily phosphohydrolase
VHRVTGAKLAGESFVASSDDHIATELAARWHELAGEYHCRMTRDAFLEGIVHRYREPHRHYHTLEHVAEILAIIDRFRERLVEYEALAFAAWFHDVIADPRARDNEERSAALARRTMRRLHVPGWMIERAAALILATRSHEPPDRSFDAALFIDADLAILGAVPKRYARYARDVRREYGFLDDDAYRAERRQVLESFVSRHRIFVTDRLHEELEEQARRNIQCELDTDPN